MPKRIEIRVNGERREVPADASRSLLNVLREDLGLLGAKYGCGKGDCGACTVLVDGQPRRSCITRLASVRAAEIRTIEGLAEEGTLHPVQRCFLEEGALQCGYCTPGMVLSAVGLLAENTRPTDREIVSAMDGNLCRCGCYPRIVRAIRKAASLSKGGRR